MGTSGWDDATPDAHGLLPMPPTVAMPLPPRPACTDAQRIAAATAFAQDMASRRTVRDFADTPVPRAVIEQARRAPGSG